MTYLRAIDQSKFTTVHFPGNRQGHNTSNIAESMNASLVAIRESGMIPMLNAIWMKYMTTRTARREASLELKESQTLTLYGQALLRKSLNWRDRNRVERGGPAGRQAQVTQINGQVHLVDLDSRSCTCGDVNYKENKVPYGHTVSLLAALHERAIDYMPAKLGRDNWVATYQENVQPVDLAIISAQAIGGAKISPPKYRPPKGRPAKKRLRKGDARKRVLVQNVEGAACRETKSLL